jgi:hypothetical protein
MDDGQPRLLQYQSADVATDGSPPWVAWVVLPSLVQLAWYVGWTFRTLETLDDGSVKQPLRDLGLIGGAALPAAAVVTASVLAHWLAPRARPRLPRLVAGLVATLFVLLTIADWVWQDIINRTESHGLM